MAGPSKDAQGDLAAHERHLQRSATRRAADAGDDDLRRILAFVRDRRSRRTGTSSVGDGDARENGANGAASPSGPPGVVVAVEDVGPTVRILRVGRPAGLRFEAGQHVRAGVAGNRRGKFSVASAPHEAHVELCVQLIPGGRLTPALFALGVGDQVEIGTSAKGRFRLDASASTHLMVATGTGIAPFRSMVRDAHHRGSGARFVILHGASHGDELPYRAELAADADVEYTPTISRPDDPRPQAWTGATGRVDPLAAEVAASLDPATTHVYACGNKGMVDQVTSALGGLGFAVSREVYD